MSSVNKYPLPFRGVGTALITPMRDGKPDLAALECLIERQITGGVSALIIMGTTGEAATLRKKERAAILASARSAAGGRIPIIVGMGTNDTHAAVSAAKYAASKSIGHKSAISSSFCHG